MDPPKTLTFHKLEIPLSLSSTSEVCLGKLADIKSTKRTLVSL